MDVKFSKFVVTRREKEVLPHSWMNVDEIFVRQIEEYTTKVLKDTWPVRVKVT